MNKKIKIFIITIAILATTMVGFVLFFNRAPQRDVPVGNTIVSPANGDIIHIETNTNNTFTFFKKDIENTLILNDIPKPYKVVVIEMDPSDVHVQRAPIAGKVIYQEHFDGAHENALSSPNVERLVNLNEKNIVVFQNDDIKVGVVQVAGKAARRIRSYISPNDRVDKGDIYGRIILGSQVVLIVPEKATILPKVGDTLIDGETIVATY